MAALNKNSAVTVLRSVTAPWIAQYPQAAVKAVSVTTKRSMASLRRMIPDDSGGRVLPPFEAVARKDRDMALTIDEHSPDEFYRVGEPLRSDLECRGPITRRGRVHRFCGDDALRQNRELAVRAVALDADALQRGAAIAWPQLQRFVQSQLELPEVLCLNFCAASP